MQTTVQRLLILCYILNYLDRTNVGFAKARMSEALGLSDTQFGFGAGWLAEKSYFALTLPLGSIRARLALIRST